MDSTEGLATKKDLEWVEQTLSGKIGKVEQTLDKKIEENSKKIDRIIIQVIDNSEAINKMVTKDEFNEFRQEVLSGQDKMMTLLVKLDQEKIFTIEWIKRIEGNVEKNKREIEGIKVKLSTA